MPRIRTIQNLLSLLPRRAALRLWVWGAAAALSIYNLQPAPSVHWPEVHLPLSLLSARGDHCVDSRTQFEGCLQAMRSLSSWRALRDVAAPDPGRLRFAALRKHNPFPEIFRHYQRAALERVPLAEHSEITALALNAWAQQLDPHAKLEPSRENNLDLLSQNEPRSSGIGLGLLIHPRQNRVLQVVRNSPAAHAGIRAGDRVLTINGTAPDRMDPRDRQEVLRGALPGGGEKATAAASGRATRIELLRNGRKITVAVTGAAVYRSNVEYALVDPVRGQKKAVISVHSLKPAGVCREVARLLLKAERRGAQRIALDLRGNPGGRVEEARCLAGLFLGPDVRFATFRRVALPAGLMPVAAARPLGAPVEHQYTDRGRITDLPLDILVDHGTASSAEILSAALQDHGRARILGERTFGKGTMQTPFHPWEREDLHLHLTTHKVFTPLGRPIQHEGVTPDLPPEAAPDNGSHGGGHASERPRERDLFPGFLAG